MSNTMVNQTPLVCPHCKKETGLFLENFTHLVVYNDVKCPHCNEIVIHVSNILCDGRSHVGEGSFSGAITTGGDESISGISIATSEFDKDTGYWINNN